MKKILFNDNHGLTQAVISGRKTQTRRIITHPSTFKGMEVRGFNVYRRSDGAILEPPIMRDADECDIDNAYILPKYKVGEIVAIAQNYSDVLAEFPSYYQVKCYRGSSGYANKMFVMACLMPHQIRITGVKVERLQNISEEDCIKEGVLHSDEYAMPYGYCDNKCPNGVLFYYSNPREAYAALIDKISGKGTWESNPWVWVYDFELFK